jgi:hypothetical protein
MLCKRRARRKEKEMCRMERTSSLASSASPRPSAYLLTRSSAEEKTILRRRGY